VSPNARFGFKLFAEIIRNGADTNAFVSPPSIALALAMTYNGAKGETQQAMAVIAAPMGVGSGLALTAVMVKGMSVNTGWSLSYVFPTLPLVISIAITLIVSQLAAIYPM
jgi:serine protease inhibitor